MTKARGAAPGPEKAGPDEAGPDEAGPVPAPVDPAPAGDAGGAAALPEVPPMLLRVTGPARGRRRAGRTFGPAPVDLPRDALSPEELAAIAADPALIVETVVEQVPAEAAAG